MRAVIEQSGIQRLPIGDSRAGLLVSVRDAIEALAAARGGADVIDIKEPDNGPLGCAEPQIIQSIVETLSGRRPVTAAAGELAELTDHHARRIASIAGLSAVKFGLFDQEGRGWADRLERLERLRSANLSSATIVPVAYADHAEAKSPTPRTVIQQAASIALPCVVLDTWNKTHGSLFDSIDAEQVGQLLVESRDLGVHLVLAGSLQGNELVTASTLAPWMIGVRGAACEGGRSGRVVSNRVKRVKQTLETHTPINS